MLKELVTRDECHWYVQSLGISMDNIKDWHKPVRTRKTEAECENGAKWFFSLVLF